MKFSQIAPGVALLENGDAAPVLFDTQSALDIIADSWHSVGCNRLILRKEDVSEEFFDLKTGLAGEILQKFVNYGVRLAIAGDFSSYTSKSLRDFIYESNNGSSVYFAPTVEDAALKLT